MILYAFLHILKLFLQILKQFLQILKLFLQILKVSPTICAHRFRPHDYCFPVMREKKSAKRRVFKN